MTFAFDNAAEIIRNYTVDTYEDEPTDVVTLAVNFASLQDGTNSVLDSKTKQMQVKTTNSGYRPLTR